MYTDSERSEGKGDRPLSHMALEFIKNIFGENYESKIRNN
jgi:hypothetical protein